MRGAVERRAFGSTGQQVAVIGQGTWQLRDPRRAAEALRAGIAAGMTHLDTAELYTGAEQVIRDAVRGLAKERGSTFDAVRQQLFVVSKVLPRHARHAQVLKACEASLQRLGMEALDCYLLHWWSDVPLEETMRAFGELLDRGWVRSVGVSNFGVQELEEAQAALGGKARIACNQVRYHLLERDIEADLVPHCAREGIAVVAYSPFGGGYKAFPKQGSKEWQALEQVGAKHGRTPRQVALRFLTREDHVFAIPKAEDPAHTRENAGGQGWTLDAEDLQRLDLAFPGPGREPQQARLS
jgi:diketogulonate reductase-like aldo/keto reductase